jgi:hypothetical protein
VFQAAKSAAEREERLKSTLESRIAESARLSERYDKLLAVSEAASIRCVSQEPLVLLLMLRLVQRG